MTESRPSLTEEEFERRATSRAPNWWAVGEELAYASTVRAIDGWHILGSPGNMMLTQAQRDLLVWIEIVREAGNGSLLDFFQEKSAFIEAAEGVVESLGWPELQRNYREAARAYMTVGGKALSASEWRQEERDHWERLREEARRFQRKRGNEPATGEDLDRAVVRMQFSGLIPMCPNREHAELDRFDDWFHTEETRVASERYVSAFIRRHKHKLAIMT